MTANTPKSILLLGATAITIATITILSANTEVGANDASPEPDHVRVLWEEDPAHRAVIAWTTDLAGTQHQVHFDTTSRGGELGAYAFSTEQTATEAYDEPEAEHVHSAKIETLEPSTKYYFVVTSDGHTSPEFWFETAPVDTRTVKLLYGGDSRSDQEMRQKMNLRMKELIASDPEILALWHGGDYIYEGYDWLEWHQWLDDHELMNGDDGRLLPIIPTRGNHERNGVIYNKVFGYPGGDTIRNYFTTQINAHARLFTLDSEGSTLGHQRRWLERELFAAQDQRWILAGYHTPAYPAVKIPGPTKQHWVPLFERYKVDVVCENDGHALKRTVPILDDAQHPDGVVYIGEGGLGVKQRTPDDTRWYLQSPGMTSAAHHVQVITISEQELRMQAIAEDGSVLDDYARAPRPERMAPGFAYTGLEIANPKAVRLFFTRGIDADTLNKDNVKIDPALTVLKASYGSVLDSIVITFTEEFAPGTVYTIDLNDVRDLQGESPQVTQIQFTLDGPWDESQEPDMGTPSEPDMAPEATPDMRDDVDMSPPAEQDMGNTTPGPGPGDGGDEDEGRCSTTPSKAPALPSPLLLGLLGGAALMRRRRR